MAKKVKKTKIVRREYTKADIKELRAHSKARTPVAKIAKLTKRTEGSLRQKARKLGIRLGHRRERAENTCTQSFYQTQFQYILSRSDA